MPDNPKLKVPERSLIVLIGSSGSGKSTFAARHFLPPEVVSLETCRGLVSDLENDQAIPGSAAFELLCFVVSLRLRHRRLTVVDATNLQLEERKQLRRLATAHDTLCSAIFLDTPPQLCDERNARRTDRNFDPGVLERHRGLFCQAWKGAEKEKFHLVFRLTTEDMEDLVVERTKLCCDKSELTGPFDIIGDIHGCADELEILLGRLGYHDLHHFEARTLIFLGDITDRGPRNLDCLNIVRRAVKLGALCVCGNHDDKVKRYLEGRRVKIGHGLAQTVAELEPLPEVEKAEIREFLDSLLSHYVLDGGNLVVAHAGLKQKYHGKVSGRVRSFCLYGDTTGGTDRFGFPVRLDWAADYRGEANVVYGHTPVPEARWLNRTINIDTGCVFGGKLTALRYPEMELVQVPAAKTYYEPVGGASRRL